MAGFMSVTKNEGFGALVSREPRLTQAKVFDKGIETPIAVDASGLIAIYQPGGKKRVPGGLIPKFVDVEETLIVLHISQVTGYDLIVDNKSGLGGAIVGGLIFGGGGAVVGQSISSNKVKRIDLQITTTDFNNPQIVVPLYSGPQGGGPLAGVGTSLYQAATGTSNQRQETIQELLSQLENMMHAFKADQAAPSVVVQQTSDADELTKYKKLLDDGVITQDEFDAKKKQILGL